jgi:hypothetical protein
VFNVPQELIVGTYICPCLHEMTTMRFEVTTRMPLPAGTSKGQTRVKQAQADETRRGRRESSCEKK